MRVDVATAVTIGVLVALFVLLVLAGVLLIKLLVSGTNELRLAAVEKGVDAVRSDVADLRSEVSQISGGLARIEHIVNVIVKNAVERGPS